MKWIVDSIIILFVMSLKAGLPLSRMSGRWGSSRATGLVAAEILFNKEVRGRANRGQWRRKCSGDSSSVVQAQVAFRAIKVVIEAVKAKITEVNSEAGEEFQAKDVLYPVGVHFRRSH